MQLRVNTRRVVVCVLSGFFIKRRLDTCKSGWKGSAYLLGERVHVGDGGRQLRRGLLSVPARGVQLRLRAANKGLHRGQVGTLKRPR